MLLAVLLAILPFSAGAAPASCAAQLWQGTAPRLLNPRLAASTHALCFTGFALLHSGVSRTPLWAAEHLTAARVAAAERMQRRGSFHRETSLPADERSELADYARSGLDRGHMAPSGDMPDATSQQESFTLANIAPQLAASNRGLWADIEQAVRRLAQAEGELWVVSGPLFEGNTLKRLHGRVLVPSGFYKAVYLPGRGAAAYVVANGEGHAWQVLSLAELGRRGGIDVFPGLAEAARSAAMTLPEPGLDERRARQPRAEGGGIGTWLLRALRGLGMGEGGG